MGESPTRPKAFRLSDAELAKLHELQEWLQGEKGPNVRVTERMTIVEALDALEWRRNELARKRKR